MNYFKISRFFLYLVPLTTVIVTRTTLFPFIVGKYTWFRSAVSLALIFFLLGLLFRKEHAGEYEKRLVQVIKSPLTIAAASFTFFFVLSGALGFNPSYSFWSNFERGEGGLQLLNLFVFFALSSALFDRKHWLKMFWMAVVSALLMVAYGVGAGLGWQWFIGPKFTDPDPRFQGSIGNPAYVAAYLIFSSFYALYIWLDQYRRKMKSNGSVFLAVSMGIFAAAFLLAATRGALVGLIGGAFAGLIFLGMSRREWRKRTLVSGLAICIAITLLIKFKDTSLVQKIPGSRVFDISLSTATLQDRLMMWGIAWKSFKERPLLGWGPESFGYLFQRNFDPSYYKIGQRFGAWFDRAHSIFFDYLAETGVLGTVSYASIFFVFYWQFFLNKKIRDTVSLAQLSAMIAIPISYLIQGLVLFDVLVIHINIFMFMAFANWIITHAKQK